MKSEEIATARRRVGGVRSVLPRLLLCVSFFTLHSSLFTSACFAQFNTDRLIMIGRSALYYEDYVLSIQYFNQAIAAKPYLYEPWFFRAVAKYYLDDYAGAEADCSEAIERNPYIVNLYELRGLTRIQQKKYSEAINDYTRALKYDPEGQNLWHNRILCRIQEKDYAHAHLELDTMLTRWSQYARGYAMRAEVYMMQQDTAQAITALDRSLELDPYDGGIWAERAIISLARSEWRESEEFLSKAIHLLPKQANNYINRALARYNQNNLRGAMADYDTALDFDPNNFLGHYNRGLLRAQVGDDNRAILDFDFVLKLEPENLMALYNRATLLDKTGDLRGAIRDYTKVIDQYPNFWTGLQSRASCYRRLGMTKQADADEFRVYKAQLYKHLYGTQPRLSKKQMRKRSDDDLEKYNQIVVADEQEIDHEYKSEYRGRVQNRRVQIELLPLFGLSLIPQHATLSTQRSTFNPLTEAYNRQKGVRRIYLSNTSSNLDEQQTNSFFAYIDSLSVAIGQQSAPSSQQLFQRAVAYAEIQNFDSAIDDLTTYLQSDTASVLALWQRAYCQSKANDFHAAQGTDVAMKTASVIGDLTEAISLSQQNAYLYYDRATVYAKQADYERAIADYNQALLLDPTLAEAWYNRGLSHLYAGHQQEGVTDLSKAGELGLYTAYSVIKKYSKK
jgi:tetratricopeptide (TPR) repeat protein